MRRVTLDFSEVQADAAIQLILRAIALLDQCSKRSDDPLFRHACLDQTNQLHDLMECFDDAVRGVPARPEVNFG